MKESNWNGREVILLGWLNTLKAKDTDGVLSLAPPTLSATYTVSSASEQVGDIERPAEP